MVRLSSLDRDRLELYYSRFLENKDVIWNKTEVWLNTKTRQNVSAFKTLILCLPILVCVTSTDRPYLQVLHQYFGETWKYTITGISCQIILPVLMGLFAYYQKSWYFPNSEKKNPSNKYKRGTRVREDHLSLDCSKYYFLGPSYTSFIRACMWLNCSTTGRYW